eukprot:jgi/Mesen1/5876/ME000299S04988
MTRPGVLQLTASGLQKFKVSKLSQGAIETKWGAGGLCGPPPQYSFLRNLSHAGAAGESTSAGSVDQSAGSEAVNGSQLDPDAPGWLPSWNGPGGNPGLPCSDDGGTTALRNRASRNRSFGKGDWPLGSEDDRDVRSMIRRSMGSWSSTSSAPQGPWWGSSGGRHVVIREAATHGTCDTRGSQSTRATESPAGTADHVRHESAGPLQTQRMRRDGNGAAAAGLASAAVAVSLLGPGWGWPSRRPGSVLVGACAASGRSMSTNQKIGRHDGVLTQGQSVRQKRVAVQIHAALVRAMEQGPLREALLLPLGFSIQEIRMSTDLRIAYIRWTSRSGTQAAAEGVLRRHVAELRSTVFQSLSLAFSPALQFRSDAPAHKWEALNEAFARLEEER